MFALSVVVLSLSVAQSPLSAEEQLEKARTAYDELEYEVAASEMMFVATRDDASEAQKVEANLYAGMANVIMGREVRARLNFRYVLAREPDTTLPAGTSPKVTSFFGLVKEEVMSEQPPAAPPTEAVTSPASEDGAEPALPPEAEASSFPWLLSVGALTTGGSVVFTGSAFLMALVMEGIYSDPAATIGARQGASWLGPTAWFLVGLGALGTAAGTGLLLWGVIE